MASESKLAGPVRALLVGTSVVSALILFQGLDAPQGTYESPSSGVPGVVQQVSTDEVKIHANPASVNWNSVARQVADSVVSIRVSSDLEQGLGSGVIIDPKGYVVTNAHVVSSMEDTYGGKITVILNDNTLYGAKIVRVDKTSDLAVLRLENAPRGLKAIAIGESSKAQVGDPVLAIGNPLGLSGTVTNGIISSLNRPMSTQRAASETGQGEGTIFNTIQTNAAINQGNSGGALVNAQGQLVGINSSIATAGAGTGNIGIGFAIPSDSVVKVTRYLIEGRDYPYGRLGVSVTQGSGRDGATELLGARIRDLVGNGAAAAGGLREGDVIVKFQGQPITSETNLVAQVREATRGEKVKVSYLRGGSLRETEVTLT